MEGYGRRFLPPYNFFQEILTGKTERRIVKVRQLAGGPAVQPAVTIQSSEEASWIKR
jgi:hypothetical protein